MQLSNLYEIQTALAQRELSAQELVEHSIARIETLNPSVNAFIDVDFDRALAQAKEIRADDERPFAGIPIAIKATTPANGFLQTAGTRILANYRPNYDAYLARRLKDAGFIVIGTTNVPEFAILPTTEPVHHGPARNPWNLDRTPGGSSGGSGAAVAAGMVPVAHGNDGGGSLRIPASCCGLVALKPSRGRVSRGPDSGDSFLACEGVLTHNTADTARMLDVLQGYEIGDTTWAPPPSEPYVQAIKRTPAKLRIAVSYGNSLGASPQRECVEAVQTTIEVLRAHGHEVTEADLPLPSDRIFSDFTVVYAGLIATAIDSAEVAFGQPADDEIEPLSRALKQIGKSTGAIDYLNAVTRLQQLARVIISFFSDYDVVLTPALAERPLPIGELTGHGDDPMADFARSGRFTPYTSLFNVTGQPAISLPVALADDGLPTNVQLVGRPLAEDMLLALAAQLEREFSLNLRAPLAV